MVVWHSPVAFMPATVVRLNAKYFNLSGANQVFVQHSGVTFTCCIHACYCNALERGMPQPDNCRSGVMVVWVSKHFNTERGASQPENRRPGVMVVWVCKHSNI